MDSVETILKICQKCLEKVPVTVLGSGASLQYGVGGMGELKDHLLSNVHPDETEAELWEKFKAALIETTDLELSLQRVTVPDGLERKIVSATRDLVICGDQSLFNRLVDGTIQLAHTRLIRHLLQTAHHQITIVTTNYDRLAEYAADAAGVSISTGFGGTYRRVFDSLNLKKRGERRSRLVEILKVHGSLDWFGDENGQQFALADNVAVPASLRPLLVTPGIGKYFATHQEPFRSIIGRTDEVFASANAILCVGYGFKDMHIQPKLRKQALSDRVPVVILARTLTPEAKLFLRECKHTHVLGLEMSGTGSRAFTNASEEGTPIDLGIWELGEFLKQNIGD